MLVHVQVVFAVQEPFVHQSQSLLDEVVNWMGVLSRLIARGLGLSRPQLETKVFFSGYFGFLPHEGSIMATNVTANILHLREKRVYWERVLIFTVTISDPQFTRLTRARVHQLRQILSTGEYSVHL